MIGPDGGEPTPDNGTVTLRPGGNVTLDASGSHDPEGASLSYAWTLDGKGDPSTDPYLVRSLTTGDHNVTVQVSDGLQTSQAQLRVRLAAAGLGELPEVALTHYFTGTISQKYAAVDDAVTNVVHPFPVPPGAIGLTLWLTWYEVHPAANVPEPGDLDLYLKDPKGNQAARSAALEFEYIRLAEPKGLLAGTWKAEITPYQATQSTYALDVIVWLAPPKVKTFQGTTTGFGADGDAGFASNKVALPDGTQIVAARLAWTVPPISTGITNCNAGLVNAADYDLYAYVGPKEQFHSFASLSCEFGFMKAASGKPLGPADWDFRVAPFAVAAGSWTLTVEYA